MVASRLFITLSLPLSSIAFQVYNEAHKSVKQACAKALAAEINCSKNATALLEGGSYRSLRHPDSVDSICTEPCLKSLRHWSNGVSDECEGEDLDLAGPGTLLLGDKIWKGWNAICLKDEETGRYCNEILDEFTEIGEDEELPIKELCHPCYGGHLSAVLPMSPYALDGGYYEKQFDLVQKKCGKKSTEASSLSTAVGVSSTSEASAKTVEPTSPSSHSTSPETTTSEASAASGSNVTESLGARREFAYRTAVLALGASLLLI